MIQTRQLLEQRLAGMPGVTVVPWKDTDLITVQFNGKEVGHFHGQTIIDLRLSPKIIRQEGLSRAMSQQVHPKRSANSRWICLEFTTQAEVDAVVRLIGLACDLR